VCACQHLRLVLWLKSDYPPCVVTAWTRGPIARSTARPCKSTRQTLAATASCVGTALHCTLLLLNTADMPIHQIPQVCRAAGYHEHTLLAAQATGTSALCYMKSCSCLADVQKRNLNPDPTGVQGGRLPWAHASCSARRRRVHPLPSCKCRTDVVLSIFTTQPHPHRCAGRHAATSARCLWRKLKGAPPCTRMYVRSDC